MRNYFYSLMTDKKNGFPASVIKAVLSLISWFYGIISGLIKFIYSLNSKRPSCKVISIGNISLGGTGKTPITCMLAKHLKSQKRNVAVLIRGYGDDEWKMVRNFLGDIPVIVGPNRVENSKYAASQFNADTVILDDGFQHWKIKRDLDIVLIDSSNPFGNGCLFPRGVLREIPSVLKRADILMLTKTDLKKENLSRIRTDLETIVPDLPILESVYKPKYLYRLPEGTKLDLRDIESRPIASLSSIVNTEYFEFILRNLGADIKLRFHYPDHYGYKQEDLNNIIEKCKKENITTIVTTEKDAVKLQSLSLRGGRRPTKQSSWIGRTQRVLHFLGPMPSVASAPAAPRNDVNVLVLHVEPEVTQGEEILNRRLINLYSN